MSAGLIKHLKYKTEQDSNTAILLAQWEFDEKLVGKALENVSSYYPHFSSHNASHSQQILVNIERLLGDNINELSATDTWLLLESAYWHDIGMLFNTDEVQEVLKDPQFLDYVESLAFDNSQDLHEFAKTFRDEGWKKALVKYDHPHTGIEKYRQMVAEWFRRGHPSSSQKVVEDPFKKLGINSPRTELLPNRIYRYLGQICLSHGIGFEQVMTDLPYRQTGMGTENCHPRYVACLLRLGDLFDIDDNRFCPVMAKQVANMPALSQHHADKHQAIREFQLDGESISITAECQTQESYIQSQHWFGWIKEEIQNQMAQWKNIVPSRNFGLLPTINKLEVVMDSPKVLLDNKPMKFSLDEKSAIELLQGKNLYDDETNIYRELIQNAVDATYMRAWIEHGKRTDNDLKITSESHPFEENFQKILAKYPLSIDFRKIEDEKDSDYAIWEFSITDKGTGISLNDLKHMQKIAGSSRNLEKQRLIKEMPVWMRPSGAFGIGLHSAFLLLEDGRPEDNKIVLETKSIIDHQAYKIEMTSPISGNDGYCFVEKLENNFKRDYGTRLSVTFRVHRRGRRYHFWFASTPEEKLLMDYQQQYDSIKKPVGDMILIVDKINHIKDKVLSQVSIPYFLNKKKYATDKENNLIWNSKYNLYFHFYNYNNIESLTDISGGMNCKFKGQNIEDIGSSDLFNLFIDFYGFDAKESLQLDRNKWNKNFRKSLHELNYFDDFFNYLFNTYKHEIQTQITNKKVFSALLASLDINQAKEDWKSLPMFNSEETKFSSNIPAESTFEDMLKFKGFILIQDHTHNNNYFSTFDENSDKVIVSKRNSFTKYFMHKFDRLWHINGGYISLKEKDGIKAKHYKKIPTNMNNLIIKFLNDDINRLNVRFSLFDKELSSCGMEKFSSLVCMSAVHENYSGVKNSNFKEPYLLLPFTKFENDENEQVINTHNLDYLIDSVYEALIKEKPSTTRDYVANLYDELITFIDNKMKVIPEWGAARERGKDFVPKDIKELEEMFNS